MEPMAALVNTYLPCTACSCSLPPAFFSKSQRKKAASGDAAKCMPCVDGVPLPGPPESPPAKPEDGFCLTMHQPWASLLVAGIKRLEGRGWKPSGKDCGGFTNGELWIHSAAHEPGPEDIELVEQQYRALYELDGPEVSSRLIFPESYPTKVSRLGQLHPLIAARADNVRQKILSLHCALTSAFLGALPLRQF